MDPGGSGSGTTPPFEGDKIKIGTAGCTPPWEELDVDDSSSQDSTAQVATEDEEILLRDEDNEEEIFQDCDDSCLMNQSDVGNKTNDEDSFEDISDYLDVSSAEAEITMIDLSKWNAEKEASVDKYRLWKEDFNFRLKATRFVEAVTKYGNKCIEVTHRAHQRKPTVTEFWNYFISKTVPRQSWRASWKIVDHEKRGWPLKYVEKAKVFVNSITFRSELATPSLDIKVLESLDPKLTVADIELMDVLLWQLEPEAPGEDFYADGISIEDGKTALQLVRNFFEFYYFGCDAEDFMSFFTEMFYERLVLIYSLGRPTPTNAGEILCSSDRGKIITRIKEYHLLRNSLQENAGLESSQASQDVSHHQDNALVTLHMRMERLFEELGYLLDPTMRKLIGAISRTDYEGTGISNYDSILVVNNLRIAGMKEIYEFLESYADYAATEDLKVVNSLETALKCCNVGATIFVVSGEYAISGLGKLEEGGSLVGIKLDNLDITVTPTDELGDVWMLSSPPSNTPVHLQNLNFVIDSDVDTSLQACLYVTSGKFTMKGCKFLNIRHPNKFERLHGEEEVAHVDTKPVVCSDSSEAEIEDCNFINFLDSSVSSLYKVMISRTVDNKKDDGNGIK